MADLIGNTLDAHLRMYDVDFIMSSTGVRWIDTELWERDESFDPHVLAEHTPTLMMWADSVESGLGEVFYRALIARVQRSRTLDTRQRGAIQRSVAQDWAECQRFFHPGN